MSIWRRLARDKHYREEYATAMLKRMIPYQTRAIRKKRDWSQAKLAEEANVTQGVISRAEDPDYGNLTLSTIGRIAAGYDLAAIVKLVPFSELIRYSDQTSEQDFANLPTFEQENARNQVTSEDCGFPRIGVDSAADNDNPMRASMADERGRGRREEDTFMYGVPTPMEGEDIGRDYGFNR